MSDINWQSTAVALGAAIRANPLAAGGANQVGQRLTAAGAAYDASYSANVAAASGIASGYAMWLSNEWTPFFNAAAQMIRYTGGTVPPFSTDLAPIQTALLSAIATMQASQVDTTAEITSAQVLLGGIQRTSASMPAQPPAAMGSVSGDPGLQNALVRAINAAQAFIAFLQQA